MSLAKVAAVCGLMALTLSACGIKAKPLAGTANLKKSPGYFGVVDDPRTVHLPCLRDAHLRFHKYYTASGHLPAIQIGKLPQGPTIVFEPTPGGAQLLQMQGKVEAAEVIGSALLYPNQASNHELSIVENCTAIGVSG
jgi:hypothetical protein